MPTFIEGAQYGVSVALDNSAGVESPEPTILVAQQGPVYVTLPHVVKQLATIKTRLLTYW